MRAIFGVLSLLIVLAIVGSLAKTQLQAVNGGIVTGNASAASQAVVMAADPGSRDGATIAIPGGMPGAMVADTNGLSVPDQARNMQQKMRDDTVRAMQKGMERNERSER